MKKNMKIGILYICTGEYKVFWKDFYISCEKFLLPKHKKYYYVFTDANKIYNEENDPSIIKIFQKNLWWPNNTLMRYNMFLKQQDKLSKMDYVFFFNANLIIVDDIWEEILPITEWIVVTLHPWFYNKTNTEFSYDRNPHSTAYIPKWKWEIYIAGWLNWWKTKNFFNLSKQINNNVKIDLKKWIIAKWHDESHINKYIIWKKYKLLNPWFLWPEGASLPFECKILIRNKSNYINLKTIKPEKFHIIWLKKIYRLLRIIAKKTIFINQKT